MTDDRPEHAEPLLIEWVAERLRFDRLAAALPGDLYPPYLLVAVGLFVEYVVFDGYNHFFTEKATFLTDPSSVVVGFAITLAVIETRRLRDAYAEAVDDLLKMEYDDGVGGDSQEVSTDESSEVIENDQSLQTTRLLFCRLRFLWSRVFGIKKLSAPLAPLRQKLVVYFIAIFIACINIFFLLSLNKIFEIQGVAVGTLRNLSVILFIYVPTITEVVVLCLGVSIFLPRRVAHADLHLFYHDPRNLGGLGSVGTALLQSYLLYMTGLSLYIVVVYIPNILPWFPREYPAPGPFLTLLFSALWSVGVVAVGYSVYRIHTFMKADKERRLDELEAAARRRVEASSDTYTEPELSPEESAAFQRRIDRVTATRTYPFGAVGSLRVGAGVLLPQTLNLVLRQLFL